MDTIASGPLADAATLAPWPSMRGNHRNTGARLFRWDGVRRPIRWLDTGAPDVTGKLSLINATPIVGRDETIFVGSSNDFFFAFRPANDAYEKWAVGGIVDSAGCFVESPKDTQTIYFPCGDYSLYSLTPPPRSLTPHPLKGSVVAYSTIDWFEGNVVTDPSGLSLYAGCDNFFMLSCRSSGTPFFRWGYPTGFFIWSACAFSDDGRTLYFASADMTLYALDSADGSERWSVELDNVCASSPAISNTGRILVGAFDGKLYSIGTDGLFPSYAADTGSLIYASPAVSDMDHRAYVVSSDGVLRAFDISKPEPRVVWEFFTGMPSFSSPAIGPDPEQKVAYLIHVGTGDGSIYALTPAGERRWSYDTAALLPDWKHVPRFDPAFWQTYPAINSSIAIGNQGVATATSGGIVLSVPYDAYLHDDGFTRNPKDNYVDQLPPSGLRLCYVSPSGRMAAKVADTTLPGTFTLVDPLQTLTLAGLSRVRGASGRIRSTFAPLPAGLQVTIDGGAPQSPRISADGTQLYIDPPRLTGGFRVRVADAGQNVLGILDCEVRSVPDPLSAPDTLARTYDIDQMSVYAPFVVPALDQLGLATITLHLRFLSIASNVAVAYACESYSSGVSGSPRRDLFYVLVGEYVDGAFRLRSGPGYYELTGAPVPVDQLTLSGVLTHDSKNYRGGSLTAAYRITVGTFLTWLLTYLTHWFDVKITGEGSLPKVLAALRRRKDGAGDARLAIAEFVARVAWAWAEGKDITAPWKLFNQASEYFWVGNYSLKPGTLSPEPGVQAAWTYDRPKLTVDVTLQQDYPLGKPPIVAILLFDDSTTSKLPLLLNYAAAYDDPVYQGRKRIRLTMTVPKVTTPVRAKVMVNLTQAPQTFVIPAS